MSAPTVADFQQSTFSDIVGTSEVTATLTWLAGDLIVVMGMTEDNGTTTLGVPTATGLTFAAISGATTNIGSSCKLYGWSATAGSDGSSAITATAATGGSRMRGIAAFVFRGHLGVGTVSASSALETVSVRSLTRAGNNSAMVWALGDWTANADVTVTATPTGTQRVATNTANGTAFVFSYGDQGAAGTANVGITGFAGVTNNVMVALEILGDTTVTVDQYGFRGRNDDGSETTATWKAAQDTDFAITPDEIFRLRLGVNTAGDLPSKALKLQYRKVGAASWRDVDTTG